MEVQQKLETCSKLDEIVDDGWYLVCGENGGVLLAGVGSFRSLGSMFVIVVKVGDGGG